MEKFAGQAGGRDIETGVGGRRFEEPGVEEVGDGDANIDLGRVSAL